MIESKVIRTILFAGVFLYLPCVSVFAESGDRGVFTYEKMSPLGNEMEKAFIARRGDDLLVLGGFEVRTEQRHANTTVYA